jgi:hypothetical protein
VRVIFKWRTDCVTGKRDAADQNARCDQIPDQSIVR